MFVIGEKISMIIYLIQIMISLAALWHYRDKRIRYLTIATAVYFMAYFATGEFDVSLSLYFVLLLIGMGVPQKVDMAGLCLIFWIAAYTIVGAVFQNLFSTVTALITRFGYIIIFI